MARPGKSRLMQHLLTFIIMKCLMVPMCLLLLFQQAEAQVATWTNNISCIVYSRCTGCHNDNGIAPFSLMTYDNAASAAFGMLGAVSSGSMPPWPPNHHYRSFAHERIMTQEEIDLIANWVNNGVPYGSGTPPPQPLYDGSEQITNPDLVLTMPNYTVNTVGNDVYRCFVVPSGLWQNKFISEIEVVPGNPEAVHHVTLYQDLSTTPAYLDALDPNPGYTSFGGTGSATSTVIGGWTPGAGKRSYPSGMGVKISAGANFVIQVHYPASANGQQDQTKVNIRYANGTVRELYIFAPLYHGNLNEGTLTIPADQVRTFTSDYTVPAANLTLLDVSAHMHLIGKSVKAWATTPSNVSIPLIDIPDWDFHWQGFYEFRRPIKIPAFSTMQCTATFDNTTANPDNPNNPPQTVTLGEATTDEMMLVYFTYAIHYPGDEDIIIDTVTSVQTYNSCDYQTLGIQDGVHANTLNAYPNPTSGSVLIDLPLGTAAMIRISDTTGRIVWEQRYLGKAIPTDGLPNGMYQMTVEMEEGSVAQKILIQR